MFSPEVIKKIKRIHIKSGRVVDAVMAGNYRSVFRGVGMEFEEVREYAVGDEVKSIDWNVSARLGRPYIKVYREERELVLMLLIDVSGSMSFGTTGVRKQDAAAEAAAILAFNAIRNNDRVGAILFTDRVEKYVPPKKGSAHIWRLIREIFTHHPEHEGTDIQAALTYLGHVCHRKTTAFLISDFFAADSRKGLRTVSRRHELIGLHVSDTGDYEVPAAGIIHMRDLETGRRLLFDASSFAGRRALAGIKEKKRQAVLEMLKKSDIDCVSISADAASVRETHVADTLAAYFRMRERKLR
ncbi:MAG: DUF58 domain-containing protein [Thermodesulfobacteriota bacterium]